MRLALATALLLSALLLPTADSDARTKGKTPHATEWDMIAFDMKSWGRPIHSWTVMHEGNGSFVVTRDKPGGDSSQYSREFREVAAGRKGFAELQALMARLPDPAPDSNSCTNFMTDMPYGTLRLTRGATTIEIAWNSGCQDENYTAFLDILKAADEKVEAWGNAGQILRTEDGGGTPG